MKAFIVAMFAVVAFAPSAFAGYPGEIDFRPLLGPDHSKVVWNGVKDVNPGAGAGLVDYRPFMTTGDVTGGAHDLHLKSLRESGYNPKYDRDGYGNVAVQ